MRTPTNYSSRRYALIGVWLAGSCLALLSARAEERLPAEAQSQIITVQGGAASGDVFKWCGPNGAIRYSNSDLGAQGFRVCGQPSTLRCCSVSGERVFAPSGKAPANSLDCEVVQQAWAQGRKSMRERREAEAPAAPPVDPVQQLMKLLQSQQGGAQASGGAPLDLQQLIQLLQPQQPGKQSGSGEASGEGAWSTTRAWGGMKKKQAEGPSSIDDLLKMVQSGNVTPESLMQLLQKGAPAQ